MHDHQARGNLGREENESEIETVRGLVEIAFSKTPGASNFTHTGNSLRAKVISKLLVLIKGSPKSVCKLHHHSHNAGSSRFTHPRWNEPGVPTKVENNQSTVCL